MLILLMSNCDTSFFSTLKIKSLAKGARNELQTKKIKSEVLSSIQYL